MAKEGTGDVAAETFTPETLHATFGGELLILQAGDHRHVHAGGHHGSDER